MGKSLVLRKSERERLLRAEIRALHGDACWYCGAELSPNQITLDHVIPACRGGLRNAINLVPACLKCNQEKDCMDLEEYRQLVYGRSRAGSAYTALMLAIKAVSHKDLSILNQIEMEALNRISLALNAHYPKHYFVGELRGINVVEVVALGESILVLGRA